MEYLFLENILFASSLVMYAYGLFSFLTLSPKGEEYYSYRAARKIFGIMMILLASCLLAHWHFDLRQQDPLLASSLCLLYITPGSMILSVILSSLIQGEYPFRRRLKEILCCAICLGTLLAVNYLFIPQDAQHIVLVASAIFFITITLLLIVRFFRLYRTTLTRADNYYSDNVGKLLEWIPITLYATILLILAAAILSVASNVSFISLYLFLGLLIFTSIFISLQNYMINIAKIKMLLLTDEKQNIALESSKGKTIEAESRESKAVKQKLEEWIENKGYTQQGLTMDDLAMELNTNRTYLSSYINAVFNLTFRGWIALHRIEYSKELLLRGEELSAVTIATMVGYSPNAFIKIFTKAEGVPPVQWRNENRS